MTQCEQSFVVDLVDDQVRCTKCGDLDDEMQLPNRELEIKEEKDKLDDFYKTQSSFE